MLPAARRLWEMSDMPDEGDLRGRALYDALMALMPAGLVETEWAESAGVNRGFFTNLKNSNISPRSDTLHKLLKHIGRSQSDLEISARGGAVTLPDLPAPRSADGEETVEIISLDLSLSMGPGTLIEEFIEEEPVKISLGFVQAITRTPSDRLRFVRGIGDSMEPTLRTGDRVMIDINDRQLARSHGVYWVDHFGTHGLKRLRPSGLGKIMVMSDNTLIPDFEADAADIRIHGRAIWFAREL